MKKYLFVLFMVVAGIMPATAQSGEDSFEEFRKQMHGDFESFRKRVNEDYANFLEGVWKQYNAFRDDRQFVDPKPQEQPKAPVDYRANPDSFTMPNQDVAPEGERGQSENQPPKSEKELQLPPTTPPTPLTPPTRDVLPEVVAPPASEDMPETEAPRRDVLNKRYMYHSLVYEVPYMSWGDLPEGVAQKEFAQLWKAYSARGIERDILPYLQQTAVDCRFNDWFFFDLVRSYVDSEMRSMSAGQRISLTHYLMAHAGYDVRIGITTDGVPLLMVAIEQDLFARAYLKVDGEKFYIFYDNLTANRSAGNSFYTCEIPSDVDCGKSLDMVIRQEPIVPYKAHSYSFTYGGIHIEGEINANLMPMLYRYPQMGVKYYAESVISESVERDVAQQIAAQISSLPKLEAVNKLLQFVQRGFSYATDDAQHGFEKPYFFEEMLYYPKCDCEDRSIFYSYLLREVLDVENHLIRYPGHESVAVNLGVKINGDGYSYQGKNFYISDPTYIGAVTGMAMENCRSVRPEIDYIR
ncbi:MAG: hypothetical protein J6Q95_03890 [Alistipes sp.]|nr:hypothetical protein [Alistipes sp.]